MLDAPPDPPLEATKKFLHTYVSDAPSMDWIRQDVRRMVARNARSIIAGLLGIEGILADPPDVAGTFSHLIAYDANWVIDDPSDEGAKIWLSSLATLLREELGDKAPPRR